MSQIQITEQEIVDLNGGHQGKAVRVIEFQMSRRKLLKAFNNSGDWYVLRGITKEDLVYKEDWFF